MFWQSKEKWIFLAVCLTVVFLMYGRSLWGDFVFDDRGVVEHVSLLSDLNQLHRIVSWPYWTEEAGLYRPTTLLSYALNFFFLGNSAWGFHLVNLLLYALTGFWIYLVIWRLFLKKPLAYLTAFLFLVLPIHSEAVANIIGRAEILALFFSLLLFWELTRSKINFWRPALWFLLAIGSKETALAALPIALLIVWLKEKSIGREVFFRYFYPALSLLGGITIYFVARFLILGKEYFLGVATSMVENPLIFASVNERVATAFKVLAIYLQKTFWPLTLCSDYSYNQIPVQSTFFNWSTFLGATALAILLIGVFAFWKRSPAISFGCVWFLLSFFLVSNFILPIGTIAGERLMFYPSLGLVLIAAWGIEKLFFPYHFSFSSWREWAKDVKWGRVLVVKILSGSIVICWLIFYSVISFQRAGDWLTEKRLFVKAAQCAPNSVLSRSNLGAIYYLEGNLAEAKKALLEAQEIYPDYPKGVNNLGLVYWKEGDKQKARELFLKALGYRFPFYGAYENLALLALEEKNWVEAEDWLLKFYSGNEAAARAYLRVYRGW